MSEIKLSNLTEEERRYLQNYCLTQDRLSKSIQAVGDYLLENNLDTLVLEDLENNCLGMSILFQEYFKKTVNRD